MPENFDHHYDAPEWARRMFEEQAEQLDGISRQLGSVHRHLHIIEHGEEGIMAAVQIEQADLDAVASSLEALVGVINGLDTTVLAPADETALKSAVADVTAAVNGKLPVTTPVTEPTPPADTPPADVPPVDTPPADTPPV